MAVYRVRLYLPYGHSPSQLQKVIFGLSVYPAPLETNNLAFGVQQMESGMCLHIYMGLGASFWGW